MANITGENRAELEFFETQEETCGEMEGHVNYLSLVALIFQVRVEKRQCGFSRRNSNVFHDVDH